MGFFSKSYYKEGPGVQKNERKKKGFFAFFEMKQSLVFLLCMWYNKYATQNQIKKMENGIGGIILFFVALHKCYNAVLYVSFHIISYHFAQACPDRPFSLHPI